MGGPGVAVYASVLTALVGIDGLIEWNVRGRVARDDSACRHRAAFCHRGGAADTIIPFHLCGMEAAAPVAQGTAPFAQGPLPYNLPHYEITVSGHNTTDYCIKKQYHADLGRGKVLL